MASSAPQMKPAAYRSLTRRLQRLAKPLPPLRPPEEPNEPKVRDPEKAAEYFAAMGAKVIKN